MQFQSQRHRRCQGGQLGKARERGQSVNNENAVRRPGERDDNDDAEVDRVAVKRL